MSVLDLTMPALPALRAPFSWFGRAAAVRRERARLARLDPARLDDLGLSPGQAWSEGNRPFWELPNQRR